MNYYCLYCQKETVHEATDFLFRCPNCQNSDSLYRCDKDDTEILKGKVIEKVYHNEWSDHSRLMIFKDGTHALAKMVDSDVMEIRLLEHEYDDDYEDDGKHDDYDYDDFGEEEEEDDFKNGFFDNQEVTLESLLDDIFDESKNKKKRNENE